ncbi:MAG: AAA family ATPase [Sandaracinaceae bacterium]
MTSLRDDLGEGAMEVRETHISWVFLHERDVYKVKKPVDFGFLDFSTQEKRRRACEAEVALNARLAPDVYHGVVPVIETPDGYRLGGDGAPVDWAVHMRRLRDEDRADVRLARGALSIADVDRIAARIAEFHAVCRSDETTAPFGGVDVVGRNVRENFAQTRETLDGLLTHEEAEEIERTQLDFLASRAELLARRMDQGRVRDGHGDLRLEHVYLEGEAITVLDCIEFNERFRYGDVCADLAFLAMDLAWHGRVDLAERALATYARESNDFELYAVVDFYESYRAYVRGKIATLLANDERAGGSARERAKAEARRYFLLSLAAERRSLLPPRMIAIGGLLATGKSTLADALGARIGAPAINTDRVRKHMLGARPTAKLYEGSWSGAYDPAFTAEVYERVYSAAKAVVASGRPVIVDASFRSRRMRADVRRAAEEAGVPFLFVECTAPHDVLRDRLRRRVLGESVSDGRVEIFDDFVKSWEPVDELASEEHVVLDTTEDLEDNLEQLRLHVPMWPEGLDT